MSDENKNKDITTEESSVMGIVIAIYVIVCTFVFYFKFWCKNKAPTETNRGRLQSNAKNLRLQLHHVKGNSMHEAIADQLMLYNRRGRYTADMIKDLVNRNNLHFSYTFYESIWMWKRNRNWEKHVSVLHSVANVYNRTIEVVHGDKTETTVIRPAGIYIKHPVQTLYIGHWGQENFVSLRPESVSLDNNMSVNGTRDALVAKTDVNTNILVGDNSKQYVIHIPSEDDSNETRVTKNIVVGDGTSQNILATFRTSNELRNFLKDMQSSGTEGSEHCLRLKIRQKSTTLTDEQIKEKEKRIVELLKDNGSETRRELDEVLTEFNVSFEKATLECILFHLKPVSVKTLQTFASRFQHGDLIKVLKLFLSKENTSTKDLHFDVQLQIYMKLSVTEIARMPNSGSYISGAHGKVTSASNKTNGMSPGISLILKRKTDHSSASELPAKDLSEKISESSLKCLGKTGLFKGATEINVRLTRLETFSSQRTEKVANKLPRFGILQHALNTMSGTMKGCIGVVRCDNRVSGNCFRVGSSYIMTAYHVVQARVSERLVDMQHAKEKKITVQFPDLKRKHHTTVVYYNKELDIAVLKLASGHTQYRPLKRVGECYPGYPFYTVGYRGSSRKTKRSVIVCTDYLTELSSSHMVLFESGMSDFDHGSSGAPGIAIINGEASIVTMLLGSIITETDALYYGVNMMEVYKQMQEQSPDLAAELFCQKYQPSINNMSPNKTEGSERKPYSINAVCECDTSKLQLRRICTVLKEFPENLTDLLENILLSLLSKLRHTETAFTLFEAWS